VLKHMHLTRDQLDEVYERLNPTPRRVLKLLEFPEEINSSESTVAQHLQKIMRVKIRDDYENVEVFNRCESPC